MDRQSRVAQQRVTDQSVRIRVAGLVGPLLILGGWYLLTGGDDPVRARYLPPPSQVLEALSDGLSNGSLIDASLATVQRFGLGFAIAALIGITCGALIGRFEGIGAVVQPILNFLRTLPGIAVLPVFVLVLGLGTKTISSVAAFSSLWLVLLNVAAGVKEVDPVVLDTSRVFGVDGWKRWWKVVLPSVAPRLATGLRLGLGIAMVVSVSGEIIIGTTGLGYVISRSMKTLRPANAYAAIFLVGILAWVMFYVGERLEKRLLPWADRGELR